MALVRPTIARCSGVLLPHRAIDGDNTLASEARSAAERIEAALSDEEMRCRFESAAPVQMLHCGIRMKPQTG